MLLDDNVVTQRETKTGSLAGWFGREERIEHFFPHFGRNAAAVVANRDLDAVAEVLGRDGKGRLALVKPNLRLTPSSRIEAVRNQVEKHARNLLREQIDLASCGVERSFQLNL